MVSDRERAQLILIGAILIATIIFGLSVLLNSLVFTGASGGTGADASIGETDLAGFEVQRNARAVIVRVNHADRSVTWNELETRIEENVTRFSRLLAESKAASSSVVVNVSYDNSTSEGGWRIVQAEDDDFNPPVGGNPVPGLTDVGWFTVNVDVANTTADTGDRFTVVVENGTAPSSREVTIDIWESSGNVSVESTYDGTTNSTTCGSTGGRVLLDLYQGSGFVDGCEFNGTARLDGPVTVEFQNAGRIQGKYSIVVDERGSISYPECTTGNDPCLSPVIWSANLTTTVRGDGISYENAYNLSLYT